ncbi:hypothetical protein M9458_038475, partial [Cirrhinus mrigala]
HFSSSYQNRSKEVFPVMRARQRKEQRNSGPSLTKRTTNESRRESSSRSLNQTRLRYGSFSTTINDVT